ncbi:multidrug resistance-associated protein 1 isoform X5 [Bemisia tabaci]|uniref:multidrug resistance-associated protein 1 isoform X5 n=1 Tax=Bemisia tabaci TaxID=7038 RepID=UPI003B284246
MILDDVCGPNSSFWDPDVSWNTPDPDFTPCFQKTALTWGPCLCFWIFSPIEISYLVNSKAQNIPWSWLNIAKMVATSILVLLCLVDVGFIFKRLVLDGSYVATVDEFTPLIKLITFIMAGIFVYANKTRGMRTSGFLFLLWLSLAICGVAQYRTLLRLALNKELMNPVYPFVSYMVYYPIVLALFILNFFADVPPKSFDYPPTNKPCPELAASFPSKLVFAWFEPFAKKGFERPLEVKDLWSMKDEDTARQIIPKFDKYWRKTVAKQSNSAGHKASFLKRGASIQLESGDLSKGGKEGKASILPALCKAFGPTFVFGSLLKLMQDLLTFISPELLKLLINFIQTESELTWRGYLYAFGLFFTATIQTIFLSQYFTRMFYVGLRIRTALISAIYRKALRISSASRKESTVGEIVNLMAVDAQRFMDLLTYLNMIWSAPLQITLAVYFLWGILGPSVLAGLAVMIVMIPINAVVAAKVKTLQIKQMKYKDERVKLMNEILAGIKVLKLYAWERSFEKQILKIRDKEIKVLKKAAYLNAATSFIWSCAPFMVSLATFAVYVLIDENNVLDAKKAFVSLALFNILRFPLSMLPMLLSNIVQASVSVKRINNFMNLQELDVNAVSHDENEKDALIIENGTFSWDGLAPTLRNINLSVAPNALVAVVGTVGSGKSSLLAASLGEMEKMSGRVNIKGSVAYVSQQAWIQNATLRENILFGKPFNLKLYNKVIEACALRPDFDMLPAGDSTEIGEKGINLSGGQKQRVNLARAVYNDREVYLLDDPLSAVDSHVGKHIFENVIGPKGLLRNKTRILVTHGLTYLPDMDQIFVMKEGEISENGSYKELLQKKGAFAEFLITHLQEIDDADDELGLKQQLLTTPGLVPRKGHRTSNSSETGSTVSLHRQASEDETANGLNANNVATGQKLIEVEKAETGSVQWHVYLHYFKAIGWSLSLATIILIIMFQGFSISSNLWLSKWSSDNQTSYSASEKSEKRNLYLEVYAALGFGQALSAVFGNYFPRIGCLLASRSIFFFFVDGVINAPLSFMDVTPSGRILVRFLKDLDVMDYSLPLILHDMVYCLIQVIATLFVISFSTPLFIVVILPISVVYYLIQRFYVPTSRQLKRLESVSRSPIYSHFGESVTGAAVIRAFGVQNRFIAESEQKVDFNQVCYFPSIIANRWLAVRLESIGNLIILSAAIFAVLGRDTLSAGLVGLSISYALQMTQTLTWLVRMTSDVETNIVAVERIKEYGETKQEAAWNIPEKAPPSTWPEKGQVVFKDFKVRYREGLELVLKGINFTVEGGEKVGIVGRTGAGKSSLTLSLFRIIESAGGAIYIDDVDISTIGLHDLRSRLTIIPQDPILFSGTLRINLDPVGLYSDEDVWRALELSHLKNFVKSLPAGLQQEVSEGGENLSVGQRQLICLARALLRKTKILILDEATAAVDLETDDLIQATIRSEFKECTVLTIAHRLNTILDSDRVLVLDKGTIVEYDAPTKLLKNRSSVFYSMAKDAGLISEVPSIHPVEQ